MVRSLVYGTLLALAIYILWQYVIQGNIARDAFKQVIAEGGNIGSLLKQMGNVSSSQTVSQLLNAFSYMALASSFLGVSLGLFDYLADFCKFKDDAVGRSKTALVTFVPPTGRAAVPERFPVRHRFRRAGGHRLGGDRAGADGTRQPPPPPAGRLPCTGRQRRDPVRYPVRPDQRRRAYSFAVRPAAGLPLIPDGRAIALPFPHCFYAGLLPEIGGASTLSQLH